MKTLTYDDIASRVAEIEEAEYVDEININRLVKEAISDISSALSNGSLFVWRNPDPHNHHVVERLRRLGFDAHIVQLDGAAFIEIWLDEKAG